MLVFDFKWENLIRASVILFDYFQINNFERNCGCCDFFSLKTQQFSTLLKSYGKYIKKKKKKKKKIKPMMQQLVKKRIPIMSQILIINEMSVPIQ